MQGSLESEGRKSIWNFEKSFRLCLLLKFMELFKNRNKPGVDTRKRAVS